MQAVKKTPIAKKTPAKAAIAPAYFKTWLLYFFSPFLHMRFPQRTEKCQIPPFDSSQLIQPPMPALKKTSTSTKTPAMAVATLKTPAKAPSSKPTATKTPAASKTPVVTAKTPAIAKKTPVVSKTPAAATLSKNSAAGSKRAREEEPVVSAKKSKKATPTRPVVTKAIVALMDHVRAHEAAKETVAQLPGMESNVASVYLQVGFRRMPQDATKTFKGRPITMPHPFRGKTTSVCMLVKDKEEAKKWLGDDEYRKHGIEKIISLQQLRKEYSTYQGKRELADRYDVFLSDDRIVCMLPKTLGKTFYQGSKKPLPIRLARKENLNGDISKVIRKAMDATYFYASGMSSAVKVGTTDMSDADLIDNVLAVVEGTVEHVPGKWKGVQSMFVKTDRSAALPIFEALAAEDVDA